MHDSDKLYFSCEVYEDVMLEAERTERVLKSISTSPKEECAARRITVLFTSPEETLFDIAKRYSVCCDEVVKNNSSVLSSEVMEDHSLPLGEKRRLIVISK